MASATTIILPSPAMDPNELIKASVTAWMFTDEDLSDEFDSESSESGSEESLTPPFSGFSFQSPLVMYPSSPPVSPLSSWQDTDEGYQSSAADSSESMPVKTSSKQSRIFQNKVSDASIDCPPQSIDWRSYYESLTPTSSKTPSSSTPTPTTAATSIGTPTRKSTIDKPRLSVLIPDEKTEKMAQAKARQEKTFARKRRAVPRPLTLWDISNGRGGAIAAVAATTSAVTSIASGIPPPKPRARSLPPSPFRLFTTKETSDGKKIMVETPCDILSAVDFDLQSNLQSAQQNIPVSVRQFQDQWYYYREDSDDSDEDYYDMYCDEDDEAYISDPGTATSMPASAYTPFSPYVPKKVYPAIQRGKQNPFPVKSIRGSTGAVSVEAGTESVGAGATVVTKETMASRLELLRRRYHDIKIASPTEQVVLKSALMSPLYYHYSLF